MTGPLCHSKDQNKMVYSGHTTVVLIFNSDHQNVGSGFSGKWERKLISFLVRDLFIRFSLRLSYKKTLHPLAVAYRLYNELGGELSSPTFPYYSSNQSVYYVIRPPEPPAGTHLMLVIIQMNLEDKDQNGNCHDWITVSRLSLIFWYIYAGLIRIMYAKVYFFYAIVKLFFLL